MLDTGKRCIVCLRRCHAFSLPLVQNKILDHTKITFIVESSAIFNILHFQELLLTQELQLALYQQELLQVSSACFVCSITFYCVNHCSRNCVLTIANAMKSFFAALDWLFSPLLYLFIFWHFQELLLQQKLQLALYQQELLQVSSARFVCSITSYCEKHCSRNCVLPIANTINSWFAAFAWLLSPLL